MIATDATSVCILVKTSCNATSKPARQRFSVIDHRFVQMPRKLYHLLFYFLAASSTMASSSSIGSKKRTRPSLAQLLPDSDVRALLRCGTKTGMCTALETLQRAGLLCTNDTNRKLRRTLQDATVQHGRSVTPYGTVIQKVDLGIPGVEPWEYCHPLAYLRHISTLNNAFGEVM